METFLSNLNQKGQGLDDARFKKSEYGALEDLGSTLMSKKKNHTGGSQSSSQTSWQSKTSKFKPALTSSKPAKSVVQAKDYTRQRIPTSSKKGNVVLSSESEGDSDESDEMNIRPSSQAGDFDEPASSQKPVKSYTQIRTNISEAIGGQKSSQGPKYYTDGAGKKHTIDPKYNSTSSALASLKFKKTKDTVKMTSTASNENQFVPKPNLWSPTPSPVKEKDSKDLKMSPQRSKTREPSLPSPLGKKSSNSNRPRSPSPSRSRPQDVEPPRPRPKPRPKRAATVSSQSNNHSEMHGSSQSKLVSMIDNVASTSRQSRVRRSESVECSSPRKMRPDPFPMRSLTSSSRPGTHSDSAPLRDSSASPVSDATKSKISASRTPSGFPMPLTPKKSIEKHDVVATVKPDKRKNKGKGKAKHDSEDEDEYDSFLSDSGSNKAKKKYERNLKKTAVKARAFPMSTQMLASIASPSAPSSSNKSSPFESPLSRKRYSDDGSDDGRISKKSRKERDLLLESPTRLPWEEGFSINISADVDPKTLCPYCDTPLPSTPSPLLVRILEATKKKSVGDPRPSNPLGLKAPLVTFITVCQRHRFESEILPEAEAKGWPKDIKWKEVSGRVIKMEKALRALIEDRGDEASESEAERDAWEVVYKKDRGNRNKNGPKARCIFWTEFLNEVKLKGLRAISGVRGQFENFEKTQPGYYGEIGSVIIHQTLYDMFPLADMDPDSISPLTPTEFVQRILVPEVALRLIMEDKGLGGDGGMAEALEILRDSSSYGVAMFPEDGGEWGGKKKKDEEKMGAGDLIVMERARKRRKELEEEEREERKLAERRKKEKQYIAVSGNSSEANEPIARPRPKPRLRKRLPDGAGVTNDILPSGSEMDLGNSSDVGKHARSRSKSILSDRSNKDDSGRLQPTLEETRRSPSASESRTFGKEGFKPRMMTRMASLSLDSDSDAGRSSRSRSRTISKRKGKDKAIPVDHEQHMQESNDDEVVIVDHKTPVARRQRTPEVLGEDETPKAQPIRREQSGGIADILRRRRKEENSKSRQVVPAPDFEKGKPTKPDLRREESFGWVLNSEE